jgi:hypothetical protein
VLAYVAISAGPDHYWDEYFYLYSVKHHAIGTLVRLESGLSGGLFPDGFFSGKILFVAGLWVLVQLVGDGPTALFAIQGVFALLVPVFVLAAHRCFRLLLEPERADRAAVVLLFLPLSIYFGWKVLSELPALLLVTLASWRFLSGVAAPTSRARWADLLAAMVLLALATLCRLTTSVGFVALVAAAWVGGRPRVAPGRLLLGGAVVFVGHLAALSPAAFFDARLGERVTHLVGSVTGRELGAGLGLYAAGMFAQVFWPFAVIALWPPVCREVRGALVWATATILPFLLAASYVEPRYFYLALPALAIVAEAGIGRVAGWLTGTRSARQLAWAGMLAAIVATDRLVLAPLMPFEISETTYRELVARIDARTDDGSLIAPWITDYCYLSFVYPHRPVVLALSDSFANGAAFSSGAVADWAGPGQYAGDLASLQAERRPWYYVAWTYNPAAVRIAALAAHLGAERLVPAPVQLLDHRTPSWIWRSPQLALTEAVRVGDYRAYEITPAPPRLARTWQRPGPTP